MMLRAATSPPAVSRLSVRTSSAETTTDAARGLGHPSTRTVALGTASSADVFRRKRRDPGDDIKATGLQGTAASSTDVLRRKRREHGDAPLATGLVSIISPLPRFVPETHGDSALHGAGAEAAVADVFLLKRREAGDIVIPAAGTRVGVDAVLLSGSGGASCTGAGTTLEVLRRKRRGLRQLAELGRASASPSRAATASSIPTTATSAASAACCASVALPSPRPYTARTTCFGLM